MEQKQKGWLRQNHWFWQIGLCYVILIVILSLTRFGFTLTNSKEWFWMAFVAMILNSVYFLSFQFFGGPKFKLEPSIQHACFCLGCGVGMFFLGTTTGMVSLQSYTNFLPMAIVAIMGLFLTGAPSNLMASMAVRAKGISPSLPFVVSGSSNFWVYLLASVLGIALPQYFKQANWNLWSVAGVVVIIIGLVLVRIYGLPVSKQPNVGGLINPGANQVSDRGLKWWLLEGSWFSKSFLAMFIITIYLTSFQFFGKVFRLDPLTQHSVYLFFMGCGIFMYSKLVGLFPAEEYKKYTPMAMVFLMGIMIGGWLNNLITVALRIPGLNPGLPFIVANTFQVIVYVAGYWLARRFSQFNRTVFNWQTGLGIVVVLAALLIIKIFG